MTNYVIYLLKCGNCKYVGSARNFRRRYLQHLKSLKEGNHSNDCLQREFKKGHRLESKILKKSYSLFNRQILIDEQRMIDRYSNCNEATASKLTRYSKKEFLMDLTDWIVKNWKVISIIIFIVCLIGFSMTPEQAQQFIKMLVTVWSSQ